MRAMVSIRLQTVEIIWWWRNLFSLSCMQDFSRKFNKKWMSKTVNVIVKNKLRASHLEFLMSLHGQACIFSGTNLFFFVFTERNSLCVCLYQTSKLYHKPGLTTLAFALICCQSFQECCNFVVNQIFNFTTRQERCWNLLTDKQHKGYIWKK